MAEVVQGTQQEFWRPPSPILSADPAILHPAPPMAEACPRCTTEFLSGSRYCHSCGSRRPEIVSPATRADAAALAGLWEQVVDAAHAGVTGWKSIEFRDGFVICTSTRSRSSWGSLRLPWSRSSLAWDA